MDKCISCKQREGDFEFQVMEVHNTRRRDPKGLAFKTQELCGTTNFSVCNSCIDRTIDGIFHPQKQIVSVLGTGFILAVFGLLLFLKFRSTNKLFSVFGIFCVVAFAYRALDFYKTSKSKKLQYQKYNQTNLRFVAAWECVSSSVPRHSGDSRVYYIPITQATNKMNPEDFVTYYGLTRANAEEFYKFLHPEEN